MKSTHLWQTSALSNSPEFVMAMLCDGRFRPFIYFQSTTIISLLTHFNQL